LTDPSPDAGTAGLGPMHPATRLGRVIQQLRSFRDLHRSELGQLADELDRAHQAELAARLRTLVGVQVDEWQLPLEELADVQAELAADPPAAAPINPSRSPKRAAWLAEQAKPRPRRDLFTPPPRAAAADHDPSAQPR
jgi:hypothetical protein